MAKMSPHGPGQEPLDPNDLPELPPNRTFLVTRDDYRGEGDGTKTTIEDMIVAHQVSIDTGVLIFTAYRYTGNKDLPIVGYYVKTIAAGKWFDYVEIITEPSRLVM